MLKHALNGRVARDVLAVCLAAAAVLTIVVQRVRAFPPVTCYACTNLACSGFPSAPPGGCTTPVVCCCCPLGTGWACICMDETPCLQGKDGCRGNQAPKPSVLRRGVLA